MTALRVFDDRACALGEGPLWHPTRKQLFWFDILAKKLLTSGAECQFNEHVSAAGWVSDTELLIASETALFRFDLETGEQAHICDLEADNPATRSNDGRADPFGGFWIGTMGKSAEPDAGAIYRYYKGEMRQLFAPITISNAICFAPDQSCAYFTDTAIGKVMRVSLDSNGWPEGEAAVFLDLKAQGLNPDGAIVAQDGSFLNAQWGAACVAQFDQDGTLIQTFDLPTDHVTCPALGGPEMTTLYVTSARQGLDKDTLDAQPHAGKTFEIQTSIIGQPEHRVIL